MIEKVTTENVLGTLLLFGLDKVDASVYIYVISQLYSKKLVSIEDKPLSLPFIECMELIEEGYVFKEGYSKKSDIADMCGYNNKIRYSFYDYINNSVNKQLLDIIKSKIDLYELVESKQKCLRKGV